MIHGKFRGAARLGLALLFTLAAFGQAPTPYTPPEAVNFRTADIYSEGTRMHAEIFSPRSAGDAKLPTILMAHGWGGTAAGLRADAVFFAKAGYLVVAFDYRGWGESDARVILTKGVPAGADGTVFTAEVREVREVVDPDDQTTDWLNALHWLHGEPQCDTARIGIWGSSYSGGHVLWVAGHDSRVKVVVSQVGAMDSRWVNVDEAQTAITYREATERARGKISYPAPSAKIIGNLRGGPIREKMMHYVPLDFVPRMSGVPTLFIIAEKEELFDNRDHAFKAYAMLTGPKKLVSIPGIMHYGVYREAREQAQQLALDWFDAYLK